MNMLFWVWYAIRKEQQEQQEEMELKPSSLESIDSLIPSPIYFFIGLLCGVGVIIVSWILFKLFITM